MSSGSLRIIIGPYCLPETLKDAYTLLVFCRDTSMLQDTSYQTVCKDYKHSSIQRRMQHMRETRQCNLFPSVTQAPQTDFRGAKESKLIIRGHPTLVSILVWNPYCWKKNTRPGFTTRELTWDVHITHNWFIPRKELGHMMLFLGVYRISEDWNSRIIDK